MRCLSGQGAVEKHRYRASHSFVVRIGKANGIDSKLGSPALCAAEKQDDGSARSQQLQFGANQTTVLDGIVANHNGIGGNSR